MPERKMPKRSLDSLERGSSPVYVDYPSSPLAEIAGENDTEYDTEDDDDDQAADNPQEGISCQDSIFARELVGGESWLATYRTRRYFECSVEKQRISSLSKWHNARITTSMSWSYGRLQ